MTGKSCSTADKQNTTKLILNRIMKFVRKECIHLHLSKQENKKSKQCLTEG